MSDILIVFFKKVRKKSLNEVNLSDSVKTSEVLFHVIKEERSFDFVFVVDLSFFS